MDVTSLLDKLVEITNLYFVVLKNDGKVIFASRNIKDIFGVEHSLLMSNDFPENNSGIYQLFQNIVKSSENDSINSHIVNDKQVTFDIFRSHNRDTFIVKFANKRVSLHDKNYEKPWESANNYHQQLYHIFNHSSDGLWVCNGDGIVLDINQASALSIGAKKKDVIGRHIQELIDDGLFDESVTMKVLKEGKTLSLKQKLKRTGKEVLVTGTPVFDENGNIILVVTNERNMYHLNRLEEKLIHSEMVAQQAKEKLTELSMLELTQHGIIAESHSMRHVLTTAYKLAKLEAANILILGQSGTGKGLLANFIHEKSASNKESFIQLNCGALPENLLEAELFGYEAGAFTGARRKGKIGLIELAHKGTLFLDEIGDMPLALQGKLLKYLDDGQFIRLGGVTPIKVDCNVIAATNKDLETGVTENWFRNDLFHRLNTFTILIPPLRERTDDIVELTRHYLNIYNSTFKQNKRLSPVAFEALTRYSFPGNVRELKNILKKAIVMGESTTIDDIVMSSIGVKTAPEATNNLFAEDNRSLAEQIASLEFNLLRNAIKTEKTTRAIAAKLKISQPTVVRKLRDHGLVTQIKSEQGNQDKS